VDGGSIGKIMREIVLDTETTGLDPNEGHRIVEIGCVELVNHVPSGRTFHRYVCPERPVDEEAFRIHGLSDDFLAQQPPFAAVVDELLAFLGADLLVIHNAEFDLRFVNAELKRLGRPPLCCAVEDTLGLARRKFPGAQARLDALCRRFEIDLSARTKHGALLDCELLAAVYLELIGGRQPGFALMLEGAGASAGSAIVRPYRPPRPHVASEDELVAHAAMVATLKEPVWLS